MSTNDVQLYYSHFQENAVDTQRAKVFDAIIAGPDFPEEMKDKMHEWMNTASSINNMGETMAKSLSVSFLRFVIATPQERSQARKMGIMHNSLQPTTKERG